MSQDTTELAKIENIAKAIPQEAWLRITNTACNALEDLISPITSTTSGVGRLIKSKFDRMLDEEKVIASGVLFEAKRKIDESNQPQSEHINAKIVIETIEDTSLETDRLMRELWANLLATEFVTGTVHPDFPTILKRLSPQDAQILAKISHEDNPKNNIVAALLGNVFSKLGEGNPFLKLTVELDKEKAISFSHEHLTRLGLIKEVNGFWRLTKIGRSFINVISGLSIKPSTQK